MGIDVCFFPIFHSSSLLPTALPSPFKYVEEAEYLVRILGFFLSRYALKQTYIVRAFHRQIKIDATFSFFLHSIIVKLLFWSVWKI